jgi:K+-transporting ATPase ATPase A chain
MNEILLVYATLIALAWPLGLYLALVYADRPTALDRVFAPIEGPIYRAIGAHPERSQTWRGWGRDMLRLHLVMAVAALLVLMGQGVLPLNPDGVPGMSWDLALHTVASFLTNTNQQHYSGQAQLSYLSQMLAIVSLQVITPAAGMAALAAILRTLFARSEGSAALASTGRVDTPVGNFYRDLVRGILRVLLPLSLVVSLILAWQGVPSTWEGAQSAKPLDPTAGLAEQRIPVGPVAPMVAIKQLGTNGGGWYGPNSAVPLENPTPLSNFVETVSIPLLPIALVVAMGFLTGRKRLAYTVLGVMLVLSALLTGLAAWSENQPNAAFAELAAPGPNLEGKEVRFGADATALWGSLTTQTSNGSVNGMHDSFNPMGGAATLMGMWINSVFGGEGVGLINYLLFLLLAAFLGSLMVGRAPEVYGRALETKEVKLLAIALLIQPLLVLGLTAATVAIPGLAASSNPGFHGLSQVLYEYSSAYANNGSGFEGLGDNTVWWNVTCAIVLILARFVPILAPLALAARMGAKRVAPVSAGTLNLGSLTFAAFTLATILMFTLLAFFPALVLGPIAEQLSLAGAH